MKRHTRVTICFAAALLVLGSHLWAGQAQPFDSWTDEQQEEFLLRGDIGRMKTVNEGITLSSRATLTYNGVEHDAQIQSVEVSKPSHPTPEGFELNFRDSYKFNIAAYRLSRLLGMNMTPVSVERTVKGKPSAVTWWIDNALMTEKTRYLKKINPPDHGPWNRQMHIVRVFDELIYNTDRNLGNIVITENWKAWMIDHTRGFRTHKQLRRPQNLLRCDRKLLDSMRTLTPEQLDRELRPYIGRPQVTALLSRRDLIVELFDKKIKEQGESAVLFDFL